MSKSTEKIFPPNKVWPQYLAVISCYFCQLTTGTTLGWISPSLVKLLADDSPIPTTSSEGATMASIMAVGGVIGPILFSYKVDIIGRKWMAFFGCLFCIISWIIMIFASEVWHLYIGRVFVGLGVGYTFGLVPIYIGEISETHMRANLSIVATVLFGGGSLFCYAVGPYISFQLLNIVCIFFPVIGFIFLIWMPESPYFLMRQGKKEEAEKTVMWLRGQDKAEYIKEELEMIENFVNASPKQSLSDTFKELKLKSNRVAMIIMTVLMLAQQFNGASALKTFFHLIIIKTETPLDPEITVLVVELIGLFVTLSSTFIIERSGRRKLCLVSCWGVIFSSFITGLYFMLKSEDIIGSESSWLALFGLFSLQVFHCIGISPIPTVIGSEMSSASIRSWYGGYKAISMSIFNSVNAKLFQILNDSVGTQYGFWMGSVVVVMCVIVIHLMLPETKGKTLGEIQDILAGKKSEKKDVENYINETAHSKL